MEDVQPEFDLARDRSRQKSKVAGNVRTMYSLESVAAMLRRLGPVWDVPGDDVGLTRCQHKGD